MSSTNKTEKLGLNIWVGSDRSQRTDFNSDNQKIDDFAKQISNKISEIDIDRIYFCGQTTGENNYEVTNENITEYYTGLTIRIVIGINSTSASTININSLGSKTIKDSLGNDISEGGLKQGLMYQLSYNGSNFQLLGKGGGGNADASKLLTGYTATTDEGSIIGTMPNIGSAISNLNCGGKFIIQEGYHNGTGYVQANSLASQTEATATSEDIIAGKTAWVNGLLLTGIAESVEVGVVSTDVIVADSSRNLYVTGFPLLENEILIFYGKAWNTSGTKYTVNTLVNSLNMTYVYADYDGASSGTFSESAMNTGKWKIMHCGINTADGAGSVNYIKIKL